MIRVLWETSRQHRWALRNERLKTIRIRSQQNQLLRLFGVKPQTKLTIPHAKSLVKLEQLSGRNSDKFINHKLGNELVYSIWSMSENLLI